MKTVNNLKIIFIAAVAALLLGATNSAVFADNINPFGMSDFQHTTQLTSNDAKCGDSKGKMKDNKCGEGKCGEGKAKMKESKCGEGKCGDGKAKMIEGKCGEGKCGDGKSKMKESKCGAME